MLNSRRPNALRTDTSKRLHAKCSIAQFHMEATVGPEYYIQSAEFQICRMLLAELNEVLDGKA